MTAYQRYVMYVKKHEPRELPYALQLSKQHLGQYTMLKYQGCVNALRIEGKNITPLPECKNRNTQYLNLGQALQAETNRIELNIAQNGQRSISMQVFTYNIYWILAALLTFSYLVIQLIYAVCQHRKPIALACMFSLAAACFAWFAMHTHYWDFAHDTGGHMDYIDYLLEHRQLPEPSKGWVYYHPPLYYVIAASLKALSQMWGDQDLNLLRAFSLLCYLGFLYFGVRTIELLSKPRSRLFYLGVMLLFFWPAGYMMSIRIDNSALYYTFSTAGFYYLLRWVQAPASLRPLLISILFLGLSFLVRSNAWILTIVMFIVVTYLLWRDKDRRKILKSWWMAAALLSLLCAVAFNMGRNIEERMHANVERPLIVGNTIYVEHWEIYVGNHLRDYLGFDMDYFKYPFFTDKVSDQRKNFWVVLLKSAVTGEKYFDNQLLVRWLNILILPLICCVVLPMFFYRARDIRETFPYLLWVGGSVAATMYNRWSVPVWTSGDFRYIMPMLPAFTGILVYQLQHVQVPGHKYLTYAVCLLSVVFVVCGWILYMGQCF